MILLIPWGLFNLAALLMFVNYVSKADCWFYLFVYPWIDEWLDREKIGLFGKWFMFLIITMFFLPAFVVYYTVFTICLLFVLMIYLLVEWRKRRKQKRQK